MFLRTRHPSRTIHLFHRNTSIPCTKIIEKRGLSISSSHETYSTIQQFATNSCSRRDIWRFWTTIDVIVSNNARVIDDNPQIVTPLSRLLVDLRSFEIVKCVHTHMILSGLGASVAVSNHLIVVYSKLGSFHECCNVFDKMPQRNGVSWTVMVSACVKNGNYSDALRVYCGMRREGKAVDDFSVSAVLRACLAIGSLCLCHQVHGELVKTGNRMCVFVGNVVIDMYVKCGSLGDAQKFFHEMPVRNVVSWTALMSGYGKHQSNMDLGFKLFKEMIHEGLRPDQSAFASLLGSLPVESLNQVVQMHAFAIKSGFGSDTIIGCALVDLYLKLSVLDDAYKLFEDMTEKNVVSWTAMIVGNMHNGHPLKALELFLQMLQSGIYGDEFTSSAVLRACASLTSLELGKQLHCDTIKRRFELDISVNNALIDMYGKCGNVMDAYEVFKEVDNPDLASWNSVVSGFSKHGHAEDAIRFFEKMQNQGVKPDSITFVALLAGCSHGGLVEKARSYFRIMTEIYGIAPREEHCSCIVDLLGRAGLLGEALEFIEELPHKPGDSVWGALLAASREQGNVEIAERAAKELMQLIPKEPITYITLANTYAAAGRWESAARVRKMMARKGMKKGPGCSWIEMDTKVHVFAVGDKSHLHEVEINGTLEVMSIHMRESDCIDQKYALDNEILCET